MPGYTLYTWALLCCLLFGVHSTGAQVHATATDTPTNWSSHHTYGDSDAVPTSATQAQQCRYWNGHVDRYTYNLTTCSHCYFYMFHSAELKPMHTVLISLNGSVFPHMTSVIPDRRNATIVAKICQTLPHRNDCDRWLECCVAAEQCCETQLEHEAPQSSRAFGQVPGDSCPSTWDGFACWQQAPAAQTYHQSCPGYIPAAMPAEDAYKVCTENGTWATREGKEWTDFTTCYQYYWFKVVIFVKLGCDVLSLLLLVPSFCIFLGYRQLRHQNRIRLHMNLFASFILFALINIIWEVCVVFERIVNSTGDSVMDSNSSGCKLLYVLTRYSNTATYLWMFCEGLYLHRLIVKAFQPPKKLILFYLIGWGLPWIPVGAYSITRIFNSNKSCWVHNIGGYEWIIYVPNLAALVANVAFLIDILRILLTQLQSHPNEPSNYRRALKATFVLVPLFGSQLFLIMYRPPLSGTAGQVYEVISAVVVHTQGFFVALIFCIINGEVHSNIRRTCNRYGYCETRVTTGNTYTGNTQTSDVYTRDSPPSSRGASCSNSGSIHNKNYMPMKPVGKDNGYFS